MTSGGQANEELTTDFAEMVRWRHHLHAHPELGFEETATSDFVATRLAAWGIEVHRGIARTGVVGVLRGRPGTGAIGLRADMDALPIQEANDLPYASKVAGRMHACGHDGHTVMLLAAAQHLAATRDFAGTVNFIFQPAEEGQGGARTMVEEGLFERFPCDAVFALHNRPTMPLGHALVNDGAMMAGAAQFAIGVTGVGGHGSRPHLTIDPIAAAGQLIQALQTIVARRIDPLEPAVVSLGSIAGGTASNVIPGKVEMVGTARCFGAGVMAAIEREMRRICDGVALATGATIDVAFETVAPPTVNRPEEAAVARAVLCALLGADKVSEGPPAPGSEDFAYMLAERPGAYVILGMREDRDIPMIHHPSYDFNDRLLPIGAGYFVRLAERRLAADPSQIQK